MQYKMIKSNRKTVAIEITRESEILVRCPRLMTKKDADAFVAKHMDWIEKHLSIVRERIEKRREFEFTDGQEIYLFGEKYILRVRGDISAAIISGDEIAVPDMPPDNLRDMLKKIYSAQLKEKLVDIVNKWAGITGLTPAGIKITEAKTRWGSCSGRNRVCFSWRLAFLDIGLIEYVVLHELCHIKHHNHSTDFYDLVERYMPDFRDRLKKLRAARDIVAL